MIPNDTDPKSVPRGLVGQVCCYKYESEIIDLEPAAFRAKVPRGIEFDDSDYASEPDTLLRPGIRVTSSPWTATENGESHNMYKQMTSGMLVVDEHGKSIITSPRMAFRQTA